jgi:hypothetical protein
MRKILTMPQIENTPLNTVDLTFQIDSRKIAFQDRNAISKKDLDIIQMPEILTKVFTSTV